MAELRLCVTARELRASARTAARVLRGARKSGQLGIVRHPRPNNSVRTFAGRCENTRQSQRLARRGVKKGGVVFRPRKKEKEFALANRRLECRRAHREMGSELSCSSNDNSAASFPAVEAVSGDGHRAGEPASKLAPGAGIAVIAAEELPGTVTFQDFYQTGTRQGLPVANVRMIQDVAGRGYATAFVAATGKKTSRRRCVSAARHSRPRNRGLDRGQELPKFFFRVAADGHGRGGDLGRSLMPIRSAWQECDRQLSKCGPRCRGRSHRADTLS